MNKSLKKISKYSFEILLIVCILFILIYGLYRKITGKKGSWSGYSIPEYKTERLYNSYDKFTGNGDKGGMGGNKGGSSKGEEICRNILEKIFNKDFGKCRPDFLRNPVTENFNLELDCFNKELGIGLEYNGEQHYKYIPYFHKNKEAFLNQKYRDELKRRMCKDNNIILIEVPYSVKHNNLEMYIVGELRKYNLV